jgi:UPF0755 protein
VSNEPSWEDIFSSQPKENPEAPAGVPYQPPDNSAPMTRRELREAEARQGSKGSKSRKPEKAPKPPKPQKQGRSGPEIGSGGGGSGRGGYDGSVPPKRRRRLGWLWAILTILILAGAAAWGGWSLYEPQIRHILHWELPIDYTGAGNGHKVTVVIASGDIGSDIAKSLHTAGVTLTSKAFYDLLLKTEPAPTFEPGTYSLQKEMSAKAALKALQDPKNKIVSKVVIPEGTTLPHVLDRLADGTGIDIDELNTAAADFTSFGLPEQAPSLEGYLFPATYSFDPGLSAHDLLQTMVTRMFKSLDAAGVAPEDRHSVVTLASLVQKEGGNVEDFYKVSRVFTNRLDQGILLQSDATVSYGSGNTSISTTAAERADASNPYNTYVHPGLPVGPICAPGDDAIDAALNPVDGSWLYFVLVNGETGETTFSNTLAEHNAAVKVWQKWLKDHPDWDK